MSASLKNKKKKQSSYKMIDGKEVIPVMYIFGSKKKIVAGQKQGLSVNLLRDKNKRPIEYRKVISSF